MALAAAWISLSAWPWYAAGFAVAASLGGCLMQWRRLPLLLELHDDGRASWRDREGKWHQGGLGRTNFVSTVLAVLELELGGNGRKWVVLMGDSISPEDFRRLRVWLRWRRTPTRAKRNNLTGG